MGLRGNLAGIRLSDIFQMLSVSQQEQTLIVRRDRDKKVFYFSPQGISVFMTPSDETRMLGEILIGLGHVSQKDMVRALNLQRHEKSRLGEILVKLGVCEQKQIEQALKLQVESAIFDLLTWDAGSFEVKEGQPGPTDVADATRVICLTFDPSGLLVEAARRMDEWDGIRQYIPSVNIVLCPIARNSDGLAPEESSLLVEKIFEHVDGRTMVRDIIKRTMLPAFDVCAGLAQLVQQGRVRLATLDELLKLAQTHHRGKDTNRAITICEQVAEGAGSNEEILSKVGRLYHRLGYSEKAAKALAAAGKLHLDAGRINEAIKLLDLAAQLNRSDLKIRRILLAALHEGGKHDRALSVARVLGELYFKRGEYAKAREICQAILREHTNDEEARFLLTEIYLATGNVEAATAESNILARSLPYGEDHRLRQLKSRIAGGRNTFVQEGNLETKSTDKPIRKASGTFRRVLTAAFVLLCIIAGSGWLWMENTAVRARGDVDRRAQMLYGQDRVREIIAEYETIIASYPYTSTARQLGQLVESLKIRQLKKEFAKGIGRSANSTDQLAASQDDLTELDILAE